MKKKLELYLFTLILLTSLNTITGQSRNVSATLSNNTTGLPVIAYPNLFTSSFHPGIEFTFQQKLNASTNNKLFISGTLAYYYHQFVQSLVKLYPSLTYERIINQRFTFLGGLGAGYGLSFEGRNAFVLQEDGSYKSKKFLGARSQYLIALELGGTYKIFQDKASSPQLLLQFKSFMQGTYVKSYVPLLPINSINLGIRIPLLNPQS